MAEYDDRADIGRCATLFERDIDDIEGLIEELKAGRYRPMDLTEAPVK